jgi:hypothetical protein
VLEGRWKMLILFHLFSAPVLRFSELRRAIAGISLPSIYAGRSQNEYTCGSASRSMLQQEIG